MSSKIDRRTFLRAGLAGGAGLSLGLFSSRVSRLEAGDDALAIPRRSLGRTGHSVGIFSLGGQATLEKRSAVARDLSIAIINRALDLGVNYCDTAPLYGPSQDYYGEVMKT